MGCCTSKDSKVLKPTKKEVARPTKRKAKKVTSILLKNNDKFHKRVVLCLCSYFSLADLAKYAQVSKLFYEISGHRKVLKLFISIPSKDCEIIGFHGNKLKYIKTSGDNCAKETEYEEMNRCYRTISFRQNPENVLESFDGVDFTNQFDIIADINRPSEVGRNRINANSGTFRSVNTQRQDSYSTFHRNESNGNFGACESSGFKPPKIELNALTEVTPKMRSHRSSLTEAPCMDYENPNVLRKMSFGEPKSQFYQSNANAQTKTSEKLQDSLTYSMSKKATMSEKEPPNSTDQIVLEIESDDDLERDDEDVTKRTGSMQNHKTSSFVVDRGAVAKPKSIYRRAVQDTSYTVEDSNVKGKEAPVKCLAEVSFHCCSEPDSKFEGHPRPFLMLSTP